MSATDDCLTIHEPVVECLRRLLWGWTLDEEDRKILDSLSDILGAPEQRPADRVPEMRDPLVQAAMRAAGADDAAMRKMLRGSLAAY